jgi:tetratricopeptide (TPR) repeat protein
MKNMLPRIGPLFVAMLLLFTGFERAMAQTASETAVPLIAATPEELSQAELLKAYLQVREQLHATQMAIVNNRVEALTEKLDAIKTNLEAERGRQQVERDRQQGEIQRAATEREQQYLETQRAHRTTLWIAAAFGILGLLAMVAMPFIQWRTLARLSDPRFSTTPQLAAPLAGDLLPAEAAGADQTITTSSQRLMSVIDRMEQRILELEHTTVSPAESPAPPPASPPKNGHWTNSGAEATRRANSNSDQATWIAVLLSKGKSLLAANKAREAVACYDEILKLDPAEPEALVRKGTALERMTRFEEALQCYERAIAADSRMTLAYVSKGSVCNRLGRYDEALECYERALHNAEKK